MTIRPGIRPPASALGDSLPVSWGNGKVVAVVNGLGAEPFVTDPLPRGVYVIQSTNPLWWNVGPGEAGDLDDAVTSANAGTSEALELAPKMQLGPDNAVVVDDDERIAVKAMDPASPANVRIFKGA